MRRRRVRKPIIFMAVLVLIASVIFTGVLVSANFSEPKELAFKESKQYIYKEYENIQFNLDYTTDKSLNKVLESAVENVFIDNQDVFENKDKVINAKLTFNVKNNLASWLFIEEGANLSEVYGTLLINTKSEEVISIEKIYGDSFKGLAMLVREKLANDDTLTYNKKTYSETLPEMQNFKYLIFKDDSVEMLFKRDKFDLNAITSIDLKYAEIMPYFSDDFAVFLDESYVKPNVENIRYIDPNKKMMALTFDDGPRASTTRDLGNYFASKDARVTYFWLGSRMENDNDIVLEMHNLGHEVGNHSYDHKSFTILNDEELQFQSDGVSKIIRDITGQKNVLLRPPFGNVNDNVKNKVKNPLINWSIDPEDWKYRNAKTVFENVEANIHDGGIAVMHDLYGSSVEGAKKILDKYGDEYQFVTVSEMFAYKGVALEDGKLYLSAKGR